MNLTSPFFQRRFCRNMTDAFVASLIAIVGLSPKIESQAHVRVIPFVYRGSISDRLLPDDEIVEVTREFDSARQDGDVTSSQAVEDAVVRSDFVGIVDVRFVDASLVDGGAWIRTRLQGTVREALKAPARYAKGQALEAFLTGGVLNVGNVVVRAGTVQRLPAPAQYLLFLARSSDPSSRELWPTYLPLVVVQGKLVSTWPSDVPFDAAEPLADMAITDVMKLIQMQVNR